MCDSLPEQLFSEFFPGYKIVKYRLDPEAIHMFLDPIDKPVCPHCGHQARVHDSNYNSYRDVPFFGKHCFLLIKVRRTECPHCHRQGTEVVDWVYNKKGGRFTNRLADTVIEEANTSAIAHIAKRYHVGEESVKTTHKYYLQEHIPKFSLGNARILAVDEFSILKGHVYATVIIDLVTRRVLFCERDRKAATLNKFFKLCGTEGCKQILAVAMDQNATFDVSFKRHCPNAVVIYDQFHVKANYGRDVISAIRLRLAQDAKLEDPDKYKQIKGSRWLLLRNNENLTKKQKQRLETLLDANQDLYKAYLLKEQLSALWFCANEDEARERWEAWKTMAMESEVEEIIDFCKRQDKRSEGIINSWKFHIGTSPLEGVNNKIKVIKRRGYGYTDFEYFSYLIKAAFPGKTGVTALCA